MKSQQLSAAFREVNTMQWQVQHTTNTTTTTTIIIIIIIIINNKLSPQLSAHNTNGCLKNMYYKAQAATVCHNITLFFNVTLLSAVHTFLGNLLRACSWYKVGTLVPIYKTPNPTKLEVSSHLLPSEQLSHSRWTPKDKQLST